MIRICSDIYFYIHKQRKIGVEFKLSNKDLFLIFCSLSVSLSLCLSLSLSLSLSLCVRTYLCARYEKHTAGPYLTTVVLNCTVSGPNYVEISIQYSLLLNVIINYIVVEEIYEHTFKETEAFDSQLFHSKTLTECTYFWSLIIDIYSMSGHKIFLYQFR